MKWGTTADRVVVNVLFFALTLGAIYGHIDSRALVAALLLRVADWALESKGRDDLTDKIRQLESTVGKSEKATQAIEQFLNEPEVKALLLSRQEKATSASAAGDSTTLHVKPQLH